MIVKTNRKIFIIAILICLAITLQGNFTLSIVKLLSFDFNLGNLTNSTVYNVIIFHKIIDKVNSEVVQFSKSQDHFSISFRNGFLRIFMLSGLFYVSAFFLSKSNYKIKINDCTCITKNNIPMKLLI